MRSFIFSIAVALLIFPLGLLLSEAYLKGYITAEEPLTCSWHQISVTDALSSGSEGKTVARSGNSLTTSFTNGGNAGCNDPVFHSYHTWTEPGQVLTPGEVLTFNVSASWSLDGDPACSSLTAGVNTWVMAGVTTITAKDSQIFVSSEPTGGVTNQGDWTVYAGTNPGDTLSITAHGEQGGVGGSVFYKYQWQCATPEPSPEPEYSATPEASPTPVGIYRILVLPKGEKDPLKLTMRLEQQVEGSFQPVSGAELRVSALDYEGNETRLADEFLAPACINCEWREASGERLAHLAQPEQPVILLSNAQGEAEIAFFLDFAKLGSSVPRRDASLNIPIAVENLATGEDGEIILAETEYVVALDAIGVVTAVTYQQAQMFDVGLNPLPVNSGPLDSYFDDPGIRDGPRTLYRGQRVLVDWPGKDSIYPTGSTPGQPLQAGVLLHSGDRVTINACDMVSNRMVDGLPAGAPGVVWVKVRFFDGTRAKVGVNGSICKSTVTFGDTPQASGWFNTSEKFFYWTSNGALNAAIGYYLWPYKIVSGLSTIGKALAWVTGNESAGWSTVYVQMKSALVVEFDETGAMQVTTREGEPVIFIESGEESGLPVPAGQTAYLPPGFHTAETQITDNETANQADALLAELLLPEEDTVNVANTVNENPQQSITDILPGWGWMALAATGCIFVMVVVAAVVLLVLGSRRRRQKRTLAPENIPVAVASHSTPGQPAGESAATWWIEVVGGPERGQRIVLGQHVRLGRKADNELPLNDKLVSSYHAQLQWISGTLVVTDLDSRNGTYVNGARISQPTRLRPGDQLLVGNTLLRVVISNQDINKFS